MSEQKCFKIKRLVSRMLFRPLSIHADNGNNRVNSAYRAVVKKILPNNRKMK